MKSLKYTLTAIVLIAGLVGCGPKPEKSQSILDSPDYHISQGMKLLNRGQADQAEISFSRALALDPKYAAAISGMALIEAEKKNYKEARDLASEAIDKDDKNPFTWAVRGRVKSLQMKGDNWAKSSDKDFEKSIKIDDQDDLTYYWWALAKSYDYDFGGASNLFSKVLEFKGVYAADANREFLRIQNILRAAPGTRVGSKIALMPKIDRADLAVLFLEELKLVEVLEKNRVKEYIDDSYAPPTDLNMLPEEQQATDKTPKDVREHWAQTWINEIIETGIMEVSPDHLFYPDQEITRAEYALFLQNILIAILHEPEIATKYIGEDPRFKDIRSNTATYNAAALCVDRGIMRSDMDGTFRPSETISGADALLIIREFQQRLSIVF